MRRGCRLRVSNDIPVVCHTVQMSGAERVFHAAVKAVTGEVGVQSSLMLGVQVGIITPGIVEVTEAGGSAGGGVGVIEVVVAGIVVHRRRALTQDELHSPIEDQCLLWRR